MATHSFPHSVMGEGIRRVKERKLMNQDEENFRRKAKTVHLITIKKEITLRLLIGRQEFFRPFFRKAGFYYTSSYLPSLNVPPFLLFLRLYKLSITPSLLTGGV